MTQEYITGLRTVQNGEKSQILNLSNARHKTYAQLQNMTPAQLQGVIICEDYPVDESVSVTADGVKTYSALLDELYNSIDSTKIRLSSSVLTIDGSFVFPQLVYADSSYLTYTRSYGESSAVCVDMASLSTSGSSYVVCKSNSARENKSSQVPTSGIVITVYY